MSKGTLEQAIAYVEQFDSGFPSRIHGISDHEMGQLEQAAGGALPEPYRRYMQRMGHGLALERLAPANYEVAAVTAKYRAGLTPPAGYWLVGCAMRDPFFDVYLWSPGGTESRMMAFAPAPKEGGADWVRENAKPLAGNLPQWLVCAAMEQYVYPKFPAYRVVSSRSTGSGALAKCDAALESHGLRPMAFSDDWKRIYEGPRGAAAATEYPGDHAALLLLAEDAATAAKWATAATPVVRNA